MNENIKPPATHLVIFDFNNAYDIQSATELSLNEQYINNHWVENNGYNMHVNNIDAILKIMYKYGFTFHYSVL